MCEAGKVAYTGNWVSDTSAERRTKPRTEGEVRAAQAHALLPSIARNSPGRPLAVVAKSNCNYDLGIKVQV